MAATPWLPSCWVMPATAAITKSRTRMRKKTFSMRATSRTTGEQPKNSLSISACATMSPCPAPSAIIARIGSIPRAISPLQVPGVGPNGGNGPLVGGEVFASPSQRKVNDTDWKDWQPRFGFAYQFSPKWVVARRLWSVLLPEQVWRHGCCPLQQSGL